MIFVCLPCLNEAESLKIIIPEIKNILKKDYKILICYDCSNDNTKKVIENFKNPNIYLLDYKSERGLGVAFNRLFLEAIKKSKDLEDIVITMDADNTHNPIGFLDIIKKLKENNDIVIQSRFCNNSYISGFAKYRIFISKSISLYMRTFFPVEKIKDYTSSYRGYQISILRKAYELYKDKFITEKEFTYTCETIIKLNKLTNKVIEIPISYKYDKKIGKSKLRLLRNGIRFFVLSFKLLYYKYIFKFKNNL